MPINQIFRSVCFVSCLLLISINTFAQDERAQEVLSKVRATLGGEAKIKAIQSLSVSGTSKHVMRMPQEHVIEEKLELQFLLPDKFLKIKTMSPPGGLGETSITEGFDGKQEWTDVNSSGPDAIFFRGDAPGELKAQMLSQRRAEFARYLLAFLLTAPNSSSVEWGYFGKAESNDGRADVLDAKADGIAVRFFFDEQTHLPLMFSYKTKILPMMAVAAPFPAPEKKTKKLEKAPLPAPDQQPVGQAKEVEIQVRLDDYREVGGLKFPHHLVFVMDEQINEEWEKLNWKVNPKLSADKFQPRKK